MLPARIEEEFGHARGRERSGIQGSVADPSTPVAGYL